MRRHGGIFLTLLASTASLAAATDGAQAQEPDTLNSRAEAETTQGDDQRTEGRRAERPEERAERERREAGLRAGVFQARGLTRVDGAGYATTPVFEGYFQKGLDKHLALESSIGFWRRTQWRQSEGGLFGEGGEEQVTSYVLPLLTAVKLYPFTAPDEGFEPYLTGGLGFALGIDDRQDTSGGFLGVGGAEGTALLTGFGFKAGAGVDMEVTGGFGVGVGARYQWMRFGAEVGGNRTYQGWALDGGLVYRFQY